VAELSGKLLYRLVIIHAKTHQAPALFAGMTSRRYVSGAVITENQPGGENAELFWRWQPER
jgi:hypothetical protein